MNQIDLLMNRLEWRQNSKKMYEAILNEVPAFLRDGIKNRIANWIQQNNIKVVTEQTVFQAVTDIAPQNMAAQIKSRLQSLRTG